MKKSALILVLCVAMTAGAYEGYAPLATGGAGGTVVNVTNTNDSGAGSLRSVIAGLSGNPTIIRFTVGGVICVTGGEIRMTRGNVTIDGSTAPSPGITIANAGQTMFGIDINGDANVIISHVRFRKSALEDLQIWDGSKIIVDHCSFTGSGDGGLDINPCSNVVVSRCIIAGCMEGNKAHGTYVSFHHNLYAWNNRRQPRLLAGGPYWDFRNNIVEYWTDTGTNLEGASDAVNIINNYYGNPGPGESCTNGFWSINDSTNVYTNGNSSLCGQDIDGMGNRGTPNTEPSVTTTSAAVAYTSVLADVGAQPTDAIDQYYINGGGESPPGVAGCGGGSSSGGGGGSGSFTSPDGSDGWTRESTETSGVGGAYSTLATYIGDTNTKQQYRSILSFDTSSIPDGAAIASATITITRLGVVGTPTNLGAITVDIKNGYYGTDNTLRAADFEAASSATAVATIPFPGSNGASVTGTLNSSGRAQINKTGLTQLKIRFATDDDNDATADYLNIYDTANFPHLDVTWN